MDADRRIQSKGRMYECNMTLRWKNSKGEIIERVGKGEDATKYGEGTEGTFRLRIGEFQLKIIVRLDEETAKIRRDDRFMIDADDFIDSMVEDGIMPNVGYIEITLVEDQFAPGDDVENRLANKVKDIVGKTEDQSDDSQNEGGWL